MSLTSAGIKPGALVAVLLLVVAGIAAMPLRPAAAQDEGYATLIIPADVLDAQVRSSSDLTMGELLETITVRVGDAVCGTVDTVARKPGDGSGTIVFPVGTPDQPTDCRTEGLPVGFTTPALAEDRVPDGTSPDYLAFSWSLEPGLEMVLTSFLPLPLAPTASDDAYALFIFPAGFVEQPVPVGIEFPGVEPGPLNEIAGYIAVYADGERCAQVPVTGETFGDVAIELGLPGQPPACSTGGAYITFRTGILPDEDMGARWYLEQGAVMSPTTLAPLFPEAFVPLGTESATIVFPAELLDAPVPDRGGTPWTDVVRTIGAYADGERCLLASAGAPGSFPIGGPYHPEPCSRGGATLTFIVDPFGDDPVTLDTSFTLAIGSTYTLESFAPLPPALEQPLPEGENLATVLVPARVLESSNVAESFGSVSVYANGERCGAIDLVDPEPRDSEGNAILALGAAGQPDACRRPGALITFRVPTQPGENLITVYFAEHGDTLVLTNFAGEPPTTGGPGDAPDPTHEPAETPPPAPPAAGNGISRGEPGGVPWLLGAIVLVVAGSGGALWAGRRRSG